MSSKEELFAREREFLEEMRKRSEGASPADGSQAEDFATLVRHYDKLLKQTSRLVHIGDRMQQELNELNHRLSVSEQKYRNIFECSSEGIFQAAPDGRLVSANPSMAKMLGLTTGELLGSGGMPLLDPPRWQSLLEALESGGGAAKAVFMIDVGGEGRWFEISTMAAAGWAQGGAVIDGVMSDVTQRKELEEKLRHYATVDGLTGLANRRHFLEIFDAEIKRSVRHDTPLSLMLLDLDRFKSINDKYGHDTGDAVLKAFARTVRKTLRSEDVVARYGGEEFCVLMPSVGLDGAMSAAGHVRKAVEKTAVTLPQGSLFFTVSIGVAERCGSSPGPESMLKAADEALYRAKHAGRNRVEAASGHVAP